MRQQFRLIMEHKHGKLIMFIPFTFRSTWHQFLGYGCIIVFASIPFVNVNLTVTRTRIDDDSILKYKTDTIIVWNKLNIKSEPYIGTSQVQWIARLWKDNCYLCVAYPLCGSDERVHSKFNVSKNITLFLIYKALTSYPQLLCSQLLTLKKHTYVERGLAAVYFEYRNGH